MASTCKNQPVENLYKWVIQEVLTRSGEDVDEGVLHDLENIWQSKLAVRRVLKVELDTDVVYHQSASSSSVGITLKPTATAVLESTERLAGVLQSLPLPQIATDVRQEHINMALNGGASEASINVEKVDGGNDSSEEGDEEEEPDNLVVCQYDEKNPFTRKGNKWVFKLKRGIMNLNGRDYAFGKADGSVNLY